MTADRDTPVVVTYLDMVERPILPDVRPPAGRKLALLRAERCSVAFYRFLYDRVGRPWQWLDRHPLPDRELAAIIQDPRVEILVLYVGGVPAGYSELDFRNLPEVTLAYFGIMPEFLGQGLGPCLLRWTVEAAWRPGVQRLLVNTCTLDHPSALPLYQRMGFRVYDQRQALVGTSETNG